MNTDDAKDRYVAYIADLKEIYEQRLREQRVRISDLEESLTCILEELERFRDTLYRTIKAERERLNGE